MSASLENQFISDKYTSLLHLSGAQLTSNLDTVYDGLGNETGIQLSTERVIINNVEMPSSNTGDISAFFDLIYPVNSIYLTTDNVNPGTRFLGTTWTQVSEGRFLAGVGSGSDKNGAPQSFTSESAGDNVGEYRHKLTIAEMPSHNHEVNTRRRRYGRTNSSNQIDSGTTGDDRYANTTYAGGNQYHNNTPPYFGVYIWKRTS